MYRYKEQPIMKVAAIGPRPDHDIHSKEGLHNRISEEVFTLVFVSNPAIYLPLILRARRSLGIVLRREGRTAKRPHR